MEQSEVLSLEQSEVLSLKQLLTTNKYIIPLYQRNYAWGIAEITQLLQDIQDVYLISKDKEYYIGTLVVDKHKDGFYEIIDGQQRHTTITLISSVLNTLTNIEKITTANLHYEAREEIQKYLVDLFSNFEKAKNVQTDKEGLNNVIFAVKEIEKYLKNLIGIEKYLKNLIEIEEFAKYFYEKVKIIRVEVPEGTDINHYFEIMNNRGEQLEKHEILKARFLGQLQNNTEESEQFSRIWDACSQMDRYILKDNLQPIELEVNPIPKVNSKNLLSFILEKLTRNNTQKQAPAEKETESKYKSIIDFPNFLLQVLKLTKCGASLDDKKLLDEFGEGEDLPNAIDFINSLLEYRKLFDKYVIKSELSNEERTAWKILQSDIDTNYKNTFSDSYQSKIIMVQSMLQVSFFGNANKTWLFEFFDFLKFITENETTIFKHFDDWAKDYFAKNYFDERKLNEKINQGTSTPRYIFNYVDYLLWLKYEDSVKGKGESKIEDTGLLGKIFKNKGKFDGFKFSQNTSIEHLHPQSNVGGLNVEKLEEQEKQRCEILNSFGNLCLISKSSNSEYTNFNFLAKKEQFSKKKNVESLKQVIMFSYDTWNTEQIQEHQQEMINLLEKTL